MTILPRSRPNDAARRGGVAPARRYILSAGHNIQADVPPANILVLFVAAFERGQYPGSFALA